MADFYEILGVPKTAGVSEIRQAYMRLARERHPDRFPDPADKVKAQAFFQDLTNAFNTLSNESRRQTYDQEHERPKPTTPDEISKESYARGLQLLEAGQHEEAVINLRGAVHHMPGEGRYHAALAKALARHPQTMREAIQSLEKATQLSPNTAAFHADLAALLHKQGMRLRAQKAAETAARLAPRDARIQKLLADIGQP
jgi:curved DNA-binding protein CbpA